MKLILRLIGLKMSILRVDAAIINPKTVKPNLYPCADIIDCHQENEKTDILYVFDISSRTTEHFG